MQKKRPNQEDDYLDIDLLCAKLEAAKREREEREAAARLRKQVRDGVRHDSNTSRDSERPRLSKRTSTSDGSKRASWYKLPTTFRKSAIHVNIPEAEPVESLDFISPVLDHGLFDEEDRDIVLLSRSSTPDEGPERKRQIKAKRSSFTVLKHFTSNDREQLRRIGNPALDRPSSANKRAQTVPFFKSKYLTSKPNLAATNELKDSCRPSDVDESLDGFLGEYTISFDTCHVKETIRHQAQATERRERPTAAPVSRPKLGSNEGMRSLLNLSSMLKKDRKDKPQFRVEEIHAAPEEDDEYQHARRPHTRSQTAPEGLICDAVTRLKNEEKKKRRSVGGLLQTLLLPNHSMSMHQVAI